MEVKRCNNWDFFLDLALTCLSSCQQGEEEELQMVLKM
jgi:hypothetical protein